MKYQVSFRALTRENNLLFSYVKISPLLWLHNKSRLSQEKNCFREMVWYFIGVYIINRILDGRLEMRNFSSRVENISLVKYFSTLEEKFCISAQPCNILYILHALTLY